MASHDDKQTKNVILANVPLFEGLNKRQISKLASVADLVSVAEGKVLVKEGALGRELLVIVEGATEVRRGTRGIAQLGPGDCIGEMSLLDREPRSATVVATEPTELVVIEGRVFKELIKDLPGLAESLLSTVSSRLREADKAFDN